MRRARKPYALQLRDELTKNTNVVVPSNGAVTAQAAPVVFSKPAAAPAVSRGTGLNSLVVATAKKVEAETPPLTYEETFRGKQDALNQILRILVYETEFSDLVKQGKITQAVFDDMKKSALQAYKMWPKEIYAAMLKYQKERMAANGHK